MTERREPERTPARARRRPADAVTADEQFIDLGRQAGNRALAELLGHAPAPVAPASPGMRILNSLRAARPAAQREFGLVAQRDLKDEQKGPGRLLKLGVQGSDVAMVQQLLGVNADGVFGPQTREAVIEFQRSAGLAADGIVGPLTFSALTTSKGSTFPPGRHKWIDINLKRGRTDVTDKEAIPESTAKIPSSTERAAIPESTNKEAIPESTSKSPSSTDKIPESDEKLT